MQFFFKVNVTLSSIGEKLGVSHQVVSKTLNGGRSTAVVSKRLERKIRETARKMGYRPSAAGRSLRSGKTMSIGVLVGPPEHFLLSPETLATLVQNLSDKGYSTTLFSTAGTAEDDYLKSPLLKEHAVDALIISYVHEPSAAFSKAVENLPMPALWLNRNAEFNSLRVDERVAAQMLAKHLVEAGHHHIGFVDYSFDSLAEPIVAERLAGVTDVLSEAGAFVSVIQKRLNRRHRSAHARSWLSCGSKRPTAVIVNSLSSAQIISQTALGMGLKVPDDIAVASFDNGVAHLANVPSITSAIRPDAEFGRVAAAMLFDLLDLDDSKLPGQSLEFALSQAESTHSSSVIQTTVSQLN